ncbi:MAG: 1-acyl-sn-glycerol-3-phosphate acyltransferase [Burkholderiales bacterium]|nr:1-acyl-sn-glycerol-3-phosphate acyltransferase [Burkholderiales bacterium]
MSPRESGPASGTIVFVRSLAFTAALVLFTPLYAVVALAGALLPRLARYRLITGWARSVLWLARVTLGIRYRVHGMENFPGRPAIILAKHQSAWETIAFQAIFPPQVYLLKRELLWIPFFGWGLALMSPIAIDRGRSSRALKRLGELGAARLAQGFCIVIFPEGTRTAPGTRGTYHPGGAWLALKTGAPVVPVAHDAGRLWGRNAFLKRPGEITVMVGEPIPSEGVSAKALTAKVEDWIESRMEALCAAR